LTPFHGLSRIPAPASRTAPGRHLLRAIAATLGILALAPDVQARSTLSARFEPQSVAGPKISQQVILVLSFFPGDGEAIMKASLGFDPARIRAVSAESARGAVNQTSTELEVDYAASPLSSAQSDSILFELVPLAESADVPFIAKVYSSERPDAVAHEVSLSLGVRSPVDVEMSASPTSLFAGERVDIRLQLHNPHPEWGVAGVDLEWPEGIVPDPEDADLSNKAIGAGDSTTVTFSCQVETGGPRVGELRGRTIAAEAHGSPLNPIQLAVAGAPELRVEAPSGRLQQGHSQRLSLEWHNPSINRRLVADVLRASVPSSFEDVAVIDDAESVGAPADVTIEDRFFGAREIEVKGPLTLESGDRLAIEVRVTPRRPGPFEWTGTFRPAGTERDVPMSGPLVWVDPADADVGDVPSETLSPTSPPTDLEAVSAALTEHIVPQLQHAPLKPGDRLRLRPTSKKSRSWVVEELLTQALMQRGVTVVVGASEDDGDDVVEEDGTHTLYYRLIDARVVYRPSGGALKSIFGAKKRARDASGDLLLRLERANGTVGWVERVRATGSDVVDDRQVTWLRSEDVVYAAVNPGNKVVELGLSGSIAIGLLAIFFAP